MAFSAEPADSDIRTYDQLQREFSAAIAAIHGLKESTGFERSSGGVGMDTRQAEMLAMFRTFLGVDYDRQIVHQVLSLQGSLHNFQSRLYSQYELGAISPESYVQQFNEAAQAGFARCEQLLGPKDFERLFGSSLADTGGLIELDQFLLSQSDRGQPIR